MDPKHYTFREANKLEKFFWACAGADQQILQHCNDSDRVRYLCLGGIVFATGLMAALAGGYAFYTIFEPRGSALDSHEISPVTLLLAFLFGGLWGAMIFNLDRFIVSSTGKGDGTEKITWSEIKTASPRIFMGLVIALTISKPIEIRMFKSEIDAALHERQLVVEKEYEERTEEVYKGRIENINKDLAELNNKQANWEESIQKLENELTEQLQGRAGAGPGDGPRAQALRNQKADVENKYKAWKDENASQLKRMQEGKQKLGDQLAQALGKNKNVANGLDGLLERIKLAHEIAGFWISMFITLLFIAIELTPILFKLTLTKTTYDYLKENIEEYIKIKNGIISRQEFIDYRGGMMIDTVDFKMVESTKLEMFGKKKVDDELYVYALEKYKEEQKSIIDADPSGFLDKH